MINMNKRPEDEHVKHELGKVNGISMSFFSVDRINSKGYRARVPIFRWWSDDVGNFVGLSFEAAWRLSHVVAFLFMDTS